MINTFEALYSVAEAKARNDKGQRLTYTGLESIEDLPGVKGNSGVDCSTPVQTRINELGAAGGGTLYVPKGDYSFAKPVVLRTNTRLVFEDGARLVAIAPWSPFTENGVLCDALLVTETNSGTTTTNQKFWQGDLIGWGVSLICNGLTSYGIQFVKSRFNKVIGFYIKGAVQASLIWQAPVGTSDHSYECYPEFLLLENNDTFAPVGSASIILEDCTDFKIFGVKGYGYHSGFRTTRGSSNFFMLCHAWARPVCFQEYSFFLEGNKNQLIGCYSDTPKPRAGNPNAYGVWADGKYGVIQSFNCFINPGTLGGLDYGIDNTVIGIQGATNSNSLEGWTIIGAIFSSNAIKRFAREIYQCVNATAIIGISTQAATIVSPYNAIAVETNGIRIVGDPNVDSDLSFAYTQTGTTRRRSWLFRRRGTGLPGSDAGQELAIVPVDDSGTAIAAVMTLRRALGALQTVSRPVQINSGGLYVGATVPGSNPATGDVTIEGTLTAGLITNHAALASQVSSSTAATFVPVSGATAIAINPATPIPILSIELPLGLKNGQTVDCSFGGTIANGFLVVGQLTVTAPSGYAISNSAVQLTEVYSGDSLTYELIGTTFRRVGIAESENRKALGFPALFIASSIPGGAASRTVIGTAITTGGTVTHPTPASTNRLTAERRTLLTTAAGAGSLAYERQNTLMLWRGNAANQGGFYFSIRFGFETLVAGNRAFIGLADIVANPTNVDPLTTTTPGGIGVAINANTGNLFLVNNVTGTARSSLDLGVNFPVNTTTLYELTLWARPNSGSINWMVINRNTGDVAQGNIATNIPANTTFLAPMIWICNNATASACAISYGVWNLRALS